MLKVPHYGRSGDVDHTVDERHTRNVNGIVMFLDMLAEISLHGLDVSGRTFNAGKGYDSENNCEELFRVDMSPNIKKRRDATGWASQTEGGRP